MIGVLFALGAAIVQGTCKIITRSVLIKEDPLTFAFIFNILGAIIFFPFFIVSSFLPTDNKAWIILAISSVLWAITTYIAFYVYKMLEVSIKTTIDRTRLIFILLIAVIFLGESLTLNKVAGIALILIGAITVSYHKEKLKHRMKWILLCIVTAILSSAAYICDKYAMGFFSASSYVFYSHFFPGLLILPFFIYRRKSFTDIFVSNGKSVIAVVALDCLGYFLLLMSFKMIEASIAVPIMECMFIVSVLGGIIFLKEREEIGKKVVSMIIALVGVLILVI